MAHTEDRLQPSQWEELDVVRLLMYRGRHNAENLRNGTIQI